MLRKLWLLVRLAALVGGGYWLYRTFVDSGDAPRLDAEPAPPPVARSFASAPSGAAAEDQAGPYPGSALPLEGGASPSPRFTIKGNESSKIFHVPGSRSFDRTIAEIWFATEEDAVAAGYRPPKR